MGLPSAEVPETETSVSVPDSSHVPILLFGSSLTGVGALRSFGRAHLPVFSVCRPDELQTKSHWYRPPPGPPSPVPEPQDIVEYLSSLPIERAVLIPCSDHWAQAVAELPEHLQERFPASISSPSIIETMTNKWLFAQMLQRVGLPHPKTSLLSSIDAMAALPDAAFENTFLKPLDSQEFSRQHGAKAFLTKGKSDAVRIMKGALDRGYDGFPILLQEYVPGPATNHYFVDGFVDRNQRISALFARQRLRMFPPLLGNSTLMETVPLTQVAGAIETIEKMWLALRYRGIFSAEFKRDDRDGEFKIIEVNARPWWFIEFATRCGIDVCTMSYRDALGIEVKPVSDYPIGRRCVYLHNDFTAYRSDNRGSGGLWKWYQSWQGADRAIFSWDDPMPAVSAAFGSLKRRLGRKRPK